MLLTAHIRKMLVNGDQWGSWYGYHIPVSNEYFVIWTPIGTPMYWKPGTWISQKHQLAYFWPNTWFTIHVGYDQAGSFLSAYCDVVLPNSYDDTNTPNTAEEFIYTDLYIDVVVRQDGSVYTKDQEVFDRAAKRYPIVEEYRQKSFETLNWLEEHAKHWTGPFSSMPQHLTRTDFEFLSGEEAQKALLSSISDRQ